MTFHQIDLRKCNLSIVGWTWFNFYVSGKTLSGHVQVVNDECQGSIGIWSQRILEICTCKKLGIAAVKLFDNRSVFSSGQSAIVPLNWSRLFLYNFQRKWELFSCINLLSLPICHARPSKQYGWKESQILFTVYLLMKVPLTRLQRMPVYMYKQLYGWNGHYYSTFTRN